MALSQEIFVIFFFRFYASSSSHFRCLLLMSSDFRSERNSNKTGQAAAVYEEP